MKLNTTHPHPAASSGEEGKEHKSLSRLKIPLWLFSAFLCGWLGAFLNVLNYLIGGLHGIWKNNTGTDVSLMALLLPFVLGVVAALIVGWRKEHRVSLAVGTGLLALTGWYVYWFPVVERAASCSVDTPASCFQDSISDSDVAAIILSISWFTGVILVLAGALLTSLIIFIMRKMKHRRTDMHQT